MDSDRLSQVLTATGHKLTRQRESVFNALIGKEAVSMRELIAAVSGRVDRVSVYRTAALFEQLGILQRVNCGFRYKLELGDAFNPHHHHLTCTVCGRVVSVKAAGIENAVTAIAKVHDFTASGHQVEIQGRCRNCRLGGSCVLLTAAVE